MRAALLILGFFICSAIAAQSKEEKLERRMRAFHREMLNGPGNIAGFIDESLNYGHSNGWIENRKEFYEGLGKKFIYHSFMEDSIQIVMNDKMAQVRFVADIDVTWVGRRNQFRLRVMEIWVKRGGNWKIFARQACR